jgi:hypothetical protein
MFTFTKTIDSILGDLVKKVKDLESLEIAHMQESARHAETEVEAAAAKVYHATAAFRANTITAKFKSLLGLV